MALDRRLYHGLAASPTASRSSSSHGRGNGNGNSKSKGSTVNSSGIYANGNSMTRQVQTTASSPSLRSAAAAHAHAIVAPSSPLVSEVESYCDADSMIMRGGDQQPSSEGGNVKVVVRVRAFVKRERERGAQCLIRMNPATQQTALLIPTDSDPANARSNARKIIEEKSFTFDKSFWSHDERDPHYTHQEDIYRSFAEEFLDHNFDGYHTCIFAYGQTGSGKSYTMMGTPSQPGLIPRTCEALFDRIENEPSPNTTYNVHVSYFEVYNEHVRDLLVPRGNGSYYLKIRESQTDGVYVQGLTDIQVKSYHDVDRLMKMGDINRTTASTKMNDTSSRSHAVFTVMLKQIQHDMTSDETIERCARMRLVDLAGSERAKATEATGQRLAEGGKINKSLSTLGRVIKALSDPRRANGGGGRKGPKDIVPYRDSVLTWLLKDSLGGNSKTAMVACIAPSDYDETLSTLRYADQAKNIRTRATVNQDAISAAERDAKIIEMQDTIRNLQLSLNVASTRKREDYDKQTSELEDYQKQVEKMQRMMEETRQVSDCKIRTLTSEVEELRALNYALGEESSTLRRHLTLALGELKNPIVIPTRQEDDEDVASVIDNEDSTNSEPMTEEAIDTADAVQEHDDIDTMTADIQSEAEEFLKDLGLFRKKVGDDFSRFGAPQPLAEVAVN